MAAPSKMFMVRSPSQSDRVIGRAVDIAKGMAIILVVFGHERVGQSWLQTPTAIVSMFHMPFFAFLSGLLFAFKGNSTDSWADGWSIICKKFRRLVIPYLTLSIFYFCLQVVGKSFFTFRRDINMDLFLNIFTDPVHSPNGTLWFLYSLFFIFVLDVIIKRIVHSEVAIFFISLVLIFPNWPDSFGLRDAFNLFPYFVLGQLLVRHCDRRYSILTLMVALPLFCLLSYLCYRGDTGIPLRTVTAIAGCLTCTSLAFLVEQHSGNDLLATIGRYAAPIYLLHMLVWAIGGRILSSVIQQDASSLPLFESLLALGCLMAAGVALPMGVTKYFIRNHPLLVKLVLGAPIRT